MPSLESLKAFLFAERPAECTEFQASREPFRGEDRLHRFNIGPVVSATHFGPRLAPESQKYRLLGSRQTGMPPFFGLGIKTLDLRF